ncbi:MAG: hypothetical protein KDC84_00225 [Crocinitomicaceae bacterium]|nr:hypothetical protein [Crocinitomicaceae bacterium]
MNKNLYIAIFSILMAFSCTKESYDNMQRNSFIKFFGSQFENSAEDLIEDNGSYVFVGYSLQDTTNRRGYIAKTNEFGNTQWEAYSFGFDHVEFHGITLGNDNTYVVCGEITDSTGQKDLYVSKFGPDGSLIWFNSFGGINDQVGNKIIRANDGGYVIIGNTTRFSGGNGNPSGYFDMMVCKIDENGDSLITNQFGGSNQDYGNDIVAYGGNQYFAVGTAQSFTGAYENFHAGKLIYIVMLSNQLGEDDAHCWGDAEDQTGNSITFDLNGNLLIGGGYLTTAGGIKEGYLLNIDVNDIRTNLDSLIINTTGLEEIYDVRVQSDGTICATGLNNVNNFNKIAVYKVGSSPLSLENNFELGYEGNAVGNRLIATSNGGFLIAGSSLYQLISNATLIKLKENVEL